MIKLWKFKKSTLFILILILFAGLVLVAGCSKKDIEKSAIKFIQFYDPG